MRSGGAFQQSHLIHSTPGQPSARQSRPQLNNIDPSIFVEVQLIEQFRPTLLPLWVCCCCVVFVVVVVVVVVGRSALLAARRRACC